MLYRDPDAPSTASILHRVTLLLRTISRPRRRQLAELDLGAMSGHLQRDLGLHEASVSDLIRR